jgi:hypothetical protein
MRRFLVLIILVFPCLFLLTMPPAAAGTLHPLFLPLVSRSSTLNVWTASPGVKVQPTTHPGTEQAVVLEGARRSYEAYQIVVSPRAALSGVDLAASDLVGPGGQRIPAADLAFFRQAFIDYTGVSENEPGSQPAPQFSPTGDGRVPDPLIPFDDPYTPGRAVGAPFTVTAGLSQPVWLDVYIPEGAAPGEYHGVITLTAEQQPPALIPVTLTVWDLLLPDMSGVTTYFGMHTGPIPDYHGGMTACSGGACWLDWGSARARAIVRRYEQELHRHRASTWQNFVPDPQGSGCTPPSSWDEYDAAMQPYMDGSYWGDGVASPWLRVPFSPGVDWGLEANCSQAQYTALAAAWAAHLRARGWFDKALVYAYDEPPESAYPLIAQHSAWLQAGDPGWKAHILDTVSPRPSNVAALNPALGIYSVALRGYDHWGYDSSLPASEAPYGRAEWPQLFAQDIRLWFYESNAQSAPYPTFAANTLLGGEPRILLWGAWYEQASGFLLWDTTAWTAQDPWGPNVGWGKSGDGVLLYPGNHDGQAVPLGSPAGVAIDGPIPSYRLKMVRLGLQDWALFRLAEQRGLGAYARGQVAQAYGQFGGCEWQGCPPKLNGEFFWKSDPALLAQVRRSIAQAIMAAP